MCCLTSVLNYHENSHHTALLNFSMNHVFTNTSHLLQVTVVGGTAGGNTAPPKQTQTVYTALLAAISRALFESDSNSAS